MQPITVNKLDLNHKLLWSYTGHMIDRSVTMIKLEARFNRETRDAGYVVFEKNDRFVEFFYTDRWYNIFEIHSVKDDHLKGWYCNIAKPALFSGNAIDQVDLALDVWINPDGTTLILDEDEFTALWLDEVTRQQAQQAVQELITLVHQRDTPFNTMI
jgi:predicted RNA-binding protein associated with RNAse of E/G family